MHQYADPEPGHGHGAHLQRAADRGVRSGTVTFTRQGANLAYRWTGGGEQNVATLRKA